MEMKRASRRPFDGNPYTRLAAAITAIPLLYGPDLCSFQDTAGFCGI